MSPNKTENGLILSIFSHTENKVLPTNPKQDRSVHLVSQPNVIDSSHATLPCMTLIIYWPLFHQTITMSSNDLCCNVGQCFHLVSPLYGIVYSYPNLLAPHGSSPRRLRWICAVRSCESVRAHECLQFADACHRTCLKQRSTHVEESFW